MRTSLFGATLAGFVEEPVEGLRELEAAGVAVAAEPASVRAAVGVPFVGKRVCGTKLHQRTTRRKAAFSHATHLDLITPTLPLLLQHLCQLLTNKLHDLVLVLKRDFLLRRMDVDVDFGWRDREGEVDEGMGVFGEQGRVEGFEGALERGAVDVAVCGKGGSARHRPKRGVGVDSRLMKKRKVLRFAW